ncbi:MAG: PAS domain S-box protein [Desulfuromusa sp.]|nr:PAS domain S-box protein [Desulfuromusa sp.]
MLLSVISPNKHKLLIVDDNAPYLKTLQEVLGETYEVQTSIDGKAALELLATNYSPDLILLDVKMPGIDGYEVCRRLKLDKKTQDIPIIFLTSLAADEDQTQGLDLGAVDFIIKPSEFSLIRRRIQTHLELKYHRAQLKYQLDKKGEELESVKETGLEREILLQKLLMSVPVAVGFVVARKIVWCNQKITDISGYSFEELEGQTTRILYPSDEVFNHLSGVYSGLQETGTCAYDTIWRTKNGVDINMHVNAAAIDKEDLSAGVIIAALDISEHKKSQKALEEKEVLYRELFNNMSSGVAIYAVLENGEDFNIEDINLSGSQISRVKLEDVVGKKVSEVFPGIKSMGLFSVFQRVWKTGIPETLPSTQYQDGDFKQWFENYVYKLPSGKIVTIYQDLTEKKMIENAIIKAKEEWEATFDAMSDMVTIHDKDMRIVRANKAAQDYFGRDYEQLIGKVCCEVFWHSSSPCSGCPLLKTYADFKTHSEIISYNIPGKVLQVTTIPISTEKNPPEHFIHVARDITDQKQLEEEASRANRLAALGELAAGVAHEINNPNALILYNSEILKAILTDLLPALEENQSNVSGQLFGGLSCQDAIQEIPVLLPAVHDSAQRIKRIVNDLRDFARQDNPDIAESINLNHVVQAAVRLVNNTIKKSTDYFELNLAKKLPAVTGVTGRLEQVVINLLLNACQALENRTQKISLTTVYAADIDRLQVIIVDEGQGMSAEVIKHIFEPFVTTKRDQGGTGLGLSVSARIVKEHHGELNFSSSPGQGTTVTLSLLIRKETDYVN